MTFLTSTFRLYCSVLIIFSIRDQSYFYGIFVTLNGFLCPNMMLRNYSLICHISHSVEHRKMADLDSSSGSQNPLTNFDRVTKLGMVDYVQYPTPHNSTRVVWAHTRLVAFLSFFLSLFCFLLYVLGSHYRDDLHCGAKKLHHFIFAITLSKRFFSEKVIGTYILQ